MGIAERRNSILRILCRRRYETIQNLAFEFGVSERTIRRDIESLSLFAPVYTQTGRYGGGVYVMENYSMDRMYMNETELELLKKILSLAEAKQIIFTNEEKKLLVFIITEYSKPSPKKGK